MIIKCPECGRDISDKAKMCLNCGYPLDEYAHSEKKQQQQPQIVLEEGVHEDDINCNRIFL